MAGTWTALGKHLGTLAIDQGSRIVVREAPRLVRRVARASGLDWGHPLAPARRQPVPPPRGTIDVRPAASAPVPSRDRARQLVYCPHLDGRADTGEIVWTWIPTAADPAEGRDQPVLLVGRTGAILLGLPLSTDPVYELDPAWIAIGAGPWSRGNSTWVRLDAVVDIPEAGIRREGAILPRPAFDRVAHRLCTEYRWY
jgi:hypothetical protein